MQKVPNLKTLQTILLIFATKFLITHGHNKKSTSEDTPQTALVMERPLISIQELSNVRKTSNHRKYGLNNLANGRESGVVPGTDQETSKENDNVDNLKPEMKDMPNQKYNDYEGPNTGTEKSTTKFEVEEIDQRQEYNNNNGKAEDRSEIDKEKQEILDAKTKDDYMHSYEVSVTQKKTQQEYIDSIEEVNSDELRPLLEIGKPKALYYKSHTLKIIARNTKSLRVYPASIEKKKHADSNPIKQFGRSIINTETFYDRTTRKSKKTTFVHTDAYPDADKANNFEMNVPYNFMANQNHYEETTRKSKKTTFVHTYAYPDADKANNFEMNVPHNFMASQNHVFKGKKIPKIDMDMSVLDIMKKQFKDLLKKKFLSSTKKHSYDSPSIIKRVGTYNRNRLRRKRPTFIRPTIPWEVIWKINRDKVLRERKYKESVPDEPGDLPDDPKMLPGRPGMMKDELDMKFRPTVHYKHQSESKGSKLHSRETFTSKLAQHEKLPVKGVPESQESRDIKYAVKRHKEDHFRTELASATEYTTHLHKTKTKNSHKIIFQRKHVHQ